MSPTPRTDAEEAKLNNQLGTNGAVPADFARTLERECAELRAMGDKVNAIRNSIIGCQGFNFSEHAYPLVAALNEAGFVGEDYPKARLNVGTLIERANKAEGALADALTQLKRARQFLPTHGSFGEDGINAYEAATLQAEAVLVSLGVLTKEKP